MTISKPSFFGEGPALPASDLSHAPPTVARTWNYRERIEREAADQFARLSFALRDLGAAETLVNLARRASQDEERHASLCLKILSECASPPPRQTPELGVRLGPPELSPRRQALYASVALSCVTETLSTALLIEMQEAAGPERIRDTVHSILEDEISHSRIGWAHLAASANEESLSWLGTYLPGMLKDAIRADAPATTAKGITDTSPWGILPPARARAIIAEAVDAVILPGLAYYRIPLGPTRAFLDHFRLTTASHG